jgi:hypothetical protein
LAQSLLSYFATTNSYKNMKINKNKLAMLCVAFCAAMFPFSHNASAVTNLGFFPDTHVVGTITPGAPADPADVASYINFMTALLPGGSGTFGGQTINRSTNLFVSLPTASAAGSISGGGTTIDLGGTVGTYSYLFAKYDGQNDNSQVWYVGNLSGIVTIPAFGPLGYGLSGWVLFQGTGFVPDGGTTVMLLGAALGALGMARRYIMS